MTPAGTLVTTHRIRGALAKPRASQSLDTAAEAMPVHPARRGRGSLTNASGRFESEVRVAENDGWDLPEDVNPLRTVVTPERAKTIITRNESPDISFDRSINPYRGCEHGCVYCFARPTHAYLGLSPGLDFETRLVSKVNAAALLERELSAPGYQPKTIAIGSNTDPYQPIERTEKIMRDVLGVLSRANHPVGIVTKSALVLRDLDLLVPMAAKGLVKVALSITTLDPGLARKMEPRASSPERRLDAMRRLSEAGVPTVVMVAPIIPAINDAEIEAILTRAHAMGAREAGYVMLRLPLEVRDLFAEWLMAHYPDKLRHVLSLVRSVRGGKLYDATFGKRMSGAGPYAWMVGRRFEAAAARLGLAKSRMPLRSDLFLRPARQGEQLQLL
ncbi:PA0069 family radical SAM protein [Methylocella tundrae]|uniref:Radical SAM protein n=1 Tax=Methylocella tundrae TaxID=227605 RepID=A0A4U8Z199_METTU|nr:Radical SAM protein [Methylocella tundrae]